jgi:hypothetical protein
VCLGLRLPVFLFSLIPRLNLQREMRLKKSLDFNIKVRIISSFREPKPELKSLWARLSFIAKLDKFFSIKSP